MAAEPSGPRVVGRRVVWDKRRLEAFEEIVEFPDGHREAFILLAGGDGVGVVAQDPQGRLILTREYRAGVGRVIHTLPGGGIGPGETVEAAARREFEEETGFTVGRLTPVIVFNSNSGWVRGDIHILRAPEPALPGSRGPNPREIEGVDLVEPSEALGWALDGRVRDSVLMVALLVLAARGELSQGRGGEAPPGAAASRPAGP
jgi:ADP-ribose pyrophosphatase